MRETFACPKDITIVWNCAIGFIDNGRRLKRFNIRPLLKKVWLTGLSGRFTLYDCKANLLWSALFLLNTVRHYAQGQRLYLRLSFRLGDPVRKHPGQTL